MTKTLTVLALCISAIIANAQPATSGRISPSTTWEMHSSRQGNLGWVTVWWVYSTDVKLTIAVVDYELKDGTPWVTWAPFRLKVRPDGTLSWVAEPELRVKYEDIKSANPWVE